MTDSYIVIMKVGEEPVVQDCAQEHVHEMIAEVVGDVTKDHFNGEFKGVKGLFFCDDIGFAKNLPLNHSATEAYLKCCRPGVIASACIVGPAIGLFGELAK